MRMRACRKTHLFDIDIPGKITFKESTNLSPGSSLTVVDTEVGRLGIGICYDLRWVVGRVRRASASAST